MSFLLGLHIFGGYVKFLGCKQLRNLCKVIATIAPAKMNATNYLWPAIANPPILAANYPFLPHCAMGN